MEAENFFWATKEIFKDEWNLSDPTKVLAVKCLIRGIGADVVLDVIETNDSDPRIQQVFRDMLRKQKAAL